jgi:hypothetical protein
LQLFNRRSPTGAALAPLLVPSVAVVGCHGGSGATTVTRILAPASHENRLDQLHVQAEPLVLVARATAYGTRAATNVVTVCQTNLRNGWLAVPPVLVIVADSPLSEPATARARIRLLDDQVRAVVRIPYVPAWRDVDNPLSVTAPPAVVRAASELRKLLSPAPTTQGVRR